MDNAPFEAFGRQITVAARRETGQLCANNVYGYLYARLKRGLKDRDYDGLRDAVRRVSVEELPYDMDGRLRPDAVRKLVDRGYLSVIDVYEANGLRRTALAAWSIELFEERYQSLYDLGRRLFTDARGLRRELDAAGVEPFVNHSDPSKVLYDVSQVALLELGEGLR